MVDELLQTLALESEENLKDSALYNIVKELSLLEENEHRITNLRRRWVTGAYEWMAGKHGSLQNLKEYFEYNDEEWHYVWNTMIKDRAWSVPNIYDELGNEKKQNFAPEMMIKFIAHDIRCHIYLFTT